MKATHNGHCQICLRLQAVKKIAYTYSPDSLAKHGYTVEWGMFNGECPGSHEAPMEQSQTLAHEWAAKLITQARKLETEPITEVAFTYYQRTGEYTNQQITELLTFENYDARTREVEGRRHITTWAQAVEIECRSRKRMAQQMKVHAATIQEYAAKLNGQPLSERK